MKILFFHRWLGVRLGGTETHIKALATRLARRGHKVHVLTIGGSELTELSRFVTVWNVSKSYGENLSSYGMRDPRLHVYTLMFMLKAFLKLLILKLKKVDFDVVSVHFITEGIMMIPLRRLFKQSFVFVLEGYTDLEGRFAKYADLQIAISKAIVDKCYANYGYKPIIIAAGIDENRFYPRDSVIQPKYNRDGKIVLTVGRLVPEKNIDVILKAAKIVCEKDKSFLFRIVGDGREKNNLERLRDDLGLQEQVKFLGRVSDAELPEIYRSADVFVLTQIAEDEFWIVAIEAMASGLPVIAPSASGRLEVLGDNGLIVPPINPDALADKILEIAYDDQMRREIVAKSLEHAKKFQWDALAVDYDRAYESVKTYIVE